MRNGFQEYYNPNIDSNLRENVDEGYGNSDEEHYGNQTGKCKNRIAIDLGGGGSGWS